MIDIKRRRYVGEVAQQWLDWVHDYFYTIKAGNKQPWVMVAGRRKTFSTYAEKLFFQLERKIQDYARGNKTILHRGKVWLRWYKVHFDAVILAPPAQLDGWVNAMKSHIRQPRFLIAMAKGVMVPYYEAIVKEYGHELVKELGIKTCPYCNRQFIYCFEAKRAERPELDHFFPKATYPMFCLSFYNLIPACHSCNHVKLEDEIGVNPYRKALKSKFMIVNAKGEKVSRSKMYKLTEKEIRLKFDGTNAEERKNVEVFGLEDVYSKHRNYVKELIDKSMAYDAYARKALVESFQGAGYHPRQVYDFVWGRHLSDAEYEDRPLSKLTKDMLDILGIKRG